MPEHTTTWRCRCGGLHFVHVERADFGEDRPALLLVEALVVAHTWRTRFGEAWNLLRRGRHLYAEVVVDEVVAGQIVYALSR